jgi:hypothetical protein
MRMRENGKIFVLLLLLAAGCVMSVAAAWGQYSYSGPAYNGGNRYYRLSPFAATPYANGPGMGYSPINPYSQPQPASAPNPAWAVCRIDNDCVAVHLSCSDWYVNRQYATDAKVYAAQQTQRCYMPLNTNPSPQLACLNHACALKPVGGVVRY